MRDVPEPNWTDLRAVPTPGWISWLEGATGWRRIATRLVLAPLYPVFWAWEAIALRVGGDVMANARAVGRASRKARNGDLAGAARAYLDECARLREGQGRDWASSYWHTLSFAGQCSLDATPAEQDRFLAEVVQAPRPFQGRFAAEAAECVSRIECERRMSSEATRWASVAVETDPTHPGPRRWQTWLARDESGTPDNEPHDPDA